MAQWGRDFFSALFTPIRCEQPPSATPKREKRVKDPAELQSMDESIRPMLNNRRSPMRPMNFEMMMNLARSESMVDVVDGARLDFGLPISPRMQVSNSFSILNGGQGSNDISLVFIGGPMDRNPAMMPGKNPILVARLTPSSGRQDVRFMLPMSPNFEMRMVSQFMGTEVDQSQVQLEAEYGGDDYTVGFKTGLALEMFSYSYTHSLSPNLSAGFELLKMNRPQSMLGFSYALKYQRRRCAFYTNYLTYMRTLTFGTSLQGNDCVSFHTDFSYNTMDGGSEVNFGFRAAFNKATVHAVINGSAVLSVSVHHQLNQLARLSLCGQADLLKQEQKFGIGLHFGI